MAKDPDQAGIVNAQQPLEHCFRHAVKPAVILFAICFVFSILYQLLVLRRDTAGGSTRMAG